MLRRIRDEFHIGTRLPGKGYVVRLNYPAVSNDQRNARLTVRDRESDSPSEIPAGSWEFVDPQSIRLLPVGARFEPYRIYDLWYEATGSTVLGTGFAATRDLVSFLRYEHADRNGMPNPMIAGDRRDDPPELQRALAFGVSQAGRFLRHFLELGMNDDGHGRRVFDGVLTHVAGAGKGVRQPQLRNAGTHRDATRGPALSRELVSVQHRNDHRPLLRQHRRYSEGATD